MPRNEKPQQESAALAPLEPPKSALATTHYGADSGAGFEDMGRDDFAIPFLAPLQKMSPQVDEDSSKHIPGAKSGMLMNTVTQKLYDGKTGIRFIPCHRTHTFIEWIPRDQGGGFVAQYQPEDPKVREAIRANGGKFGKVKIGDGNDLVETFSVFGLLLNEDGTVDQIIISFSSANIKHYQKWMTTARNIQTRDDEGRRVTPPLFAHVYKLRTEFRENKKGAWHGWAWAFDGADAEACRLPEDSPLYLDAKAFRDLVKSGVAKADYSSADAGGADDSDDDTM